MSYSQNNEEAKISEYFIHQTGKLMDIGAFHPFVFSNTRRLYELGWDCVFVEPSAICFQKFKEEYDGEKGVVLINAAITVSGEEVKFYESNGDALSTTDIAHKKKWERQGVPFKEIPVNSIAIESLMKEYKGIDFLNLDVEGKNIELFKAIPDWFLRRLKMICIEHDGQESLIGDRLSKFGFVCIMKNSENILLAK